METVPESRIIPVAASPVFLEPSKTASVGIDSHPHRHRHGEEPPVSLEPTYTSLLTSPVLYGTIMATPSFVSCHFVKLKLLNKEWLMATY